MREYDIIVFPHYCIPKVLYNIPWFKIIKNVLFIMRNESIRNMASAFD